MTNNKRKAPFKIMKNKLISSLLLTAILLSSFASCSEAPAETGDASLLFVAIAVISLAGVAIVAKKREN